MDDFPGLLARDFGFRPQGKSAPMSAAKSSSFGSGSGSASANPLAFDDVFGGPPKYPNQRQSNPAAPPSSSSSAFDSIFDGFKDPSLNPKSSSMPPVYDKPVYDDDIFVGVPGMKSTYKGAAKVEYKDVFVSNSKGGGRAKEEQAGAYDDLLGSLGKNSSSRVESKKRSEDLSGFDELIPGFGGSSPPARREPSVNNQQKLAGSTAKSSSMLEDPFVSLEANSAPAYPSSGMVSDPLEQLGRQMNSGSANDSSPESGGIFDDIDAFDGLARSVPSVRSKKNENQKDKNPLRSGPERTQERSPPESFENVVPKTQSRRSFNSTSSVRSPKSYSHSYVKNVTPDQSPKYSNNLETADDVWLTVSEIPLFTQPTNAPPPSRPPPPLVIKQVPVGRKDPRRKDTESNSQSSQSYLYSRGSVTVPNTSSMDELEDFAMGKSQNNEPAGVFPDEDDIESNSAAAASAAAMKAAMDRAEAKFKHAKEVRERERDVRSARSRDFSEQERDDFDELEDKERQEKSDHEQKEKEEREREQKRLGKERELEREKARQAVERATREARERASAEARLRTERAAVGKANAEARQRAERAAVQRAAAEARERAGAEAKERAERAAAEARERAAAEAREKAARERAAEAREKATADARERAAVDRAAAEARHRAERAAVDRAHAEARERAAAAAREKQHKTEDDLDSFFGMGSRATSAPKQRATTSENVFDTQSQSRGSADGTRRPSSTSSTIRKASSTTNIVDDLSSIFGGAPSAGEFQEVEGESEDRRRARLERHERTLGRAAKALAEKNERDMQTLREQAERNRISETLDMEIKRWAAGKEGNLRALLSTLQYVLWPECGWQPVSLTDLITAAAVKKVYRKATLCIHPDKVQQKGANLQQKYIAEKVFDLLKEAWNKLNSEELF